MIELLRGRKWLRNGNGATLAVAEESRADQLPAAVTKLGASHQL